MTFNVQQMDKVIRVQNTLAVAYGPNDKMEACHSTLCGCTQSVDVVLAMNHITAARTALRNAHAFLCRVTVEHPELRDQVQAMHANPQPQPADG